MYKQMYNERHDFYEHQLPLLPDTMQQLSLRAEWTFWLHITEINLILDWY
jgi:hypothetical protein